MTETTLSSYIVSLRGAFTGTEEDESGQESLVARVVVDADGETHEVYPQLPTPENPDPPSWRGIAEITGFRGPEVAAAWIGEVKNPLIDEAFKYLHQLASPNTDYTLEIKDTPYFKKHLSKGHRNTLIRESTKAERHATPTKVIAVEGPVFVGPDERRMWIKVHHTGENGEPTYTLIALPDEDLDPDEGACPVYFHIEMITNVPGSYVFESWTHDRVRDEHTNPGVTTAVNRLRKALIDDSIQLFLNDDGSLDLRRARRDILRSRIAPEDNTRGAACHYFTRWNTLARVRLWSVIDDLPFHMYRMIDEPGTSGTLCTVGKDNAKGGKSFIRMLRTYSSLNHELSRYINWSTVDKKGRIQVRAVDKQVLTEMVEQPNNRLPEIKGIMTMPVMNDDGIITCIEDYDSGSCFYIHPSIIVRNEDIPDKPTAEDVHKARMHIHDIFCDMAYQGYSSEPSYDKLMPNPYYTATLCIVLEQVVRNMIRGPRPMYAITAEGIGQSSGKTLLANICGSLIHGNTRHDRRWPGNDEELSKLITAIVRQRQAYVVFDNLTDIVKSDAMAILTTSNSWTGRVLGQNKELSAENITTWVLTLNNAELSKDLARRTVMIVLDHNMARAFDAHKNKKYRHPSPINYINNSKDDIVRTKVIRALMLMTRYWIQAGRPIDPHADMPSFREWVRVVPAILHHAGYASIQGAIDNANARDIENDELKALLDFWWTAYGEQWVKPTVLAQSAQANDVPIDLQGKGTWAGRRLAQKLKRIVDREFGGYVVRYDQTNGAVFFAVQRAEDADAALPALN